MSISVAKVLQVNKEFIRHEENLRDIEISILSNTTIKILEPLPFEEQKPQNIGPIEMKNSKLAVEKIVGKKLKSKK